jgi:hypothetical protein
MRGAEMTKPRLHMLPCQFLIVLSILMIACSPAYASIIISDNLYDNSLNAAFWTHVIMGNGLVS